jgi:hypothetical protein
MTMSACCNHDAQIAGTTQSERGIINIHMMARYSTTTIAIDDNWRTLVGAPIIIARKVPWEANGDDEMVNGK